ncbi:MAG: transporter [Desulfuromonadales bacterium]|nr:transporter [Desulfuromonadales bacterium]
MQGGRLMLRFVAGSLAALVLTVATPAWSLDQPAVNLGFTSFLDGGPPAGPGFYFTEYLQYYRADRLTDNRGGKLLPAPSDPEIEAWVSLSQFIYQSNTPVLLGGKWGLDVIVPLVSVDTDSPYLSDNGTGLGDILVGPFLQWDPIMGANGPRFMHRIELQMIFPTGRYDEDKNLNPGSNHFSFNPYWAATLFVTPRLTASWRLHYLWNDENDDTKVKPGQAVHANFATEYAVIPNILRLGVNGYYLRQVSDSEIDGRKVSSSDGPIFGRERVLAIGPGAIWHLSRDSHLFFNAYFETEARLRPEGERYLLRFVHHF